MTEPLVLALLTAAVPGLLLRRGGFEEEGVPLAVVVTEGSPETLARKAARRATLGLGIGGDHDRLVLVLAAFSGRPYLEAMASEVRTMGSRCRSNRCPAPASGQGPAERANRLGVVDDHASSGLARLHPPEGVVDVVEVQAVISGSSRRLPPR